MNEREGEAEKSERDNMERKDIGNKAEGKKQGQT